MGFTLITYQSGHDHGLDVMLLHPFSQPDINASQVLADSRAPQFATAGLSTKYLAQVYSVKPLKYTQTIGNS